MTSSESTSPMRGATTRTLSKPTLVCVILASAAGLLWQGVACLAVHGRLRDARDHEGAADLSVVAAVKAALRIPVLSNGNVRRKAEADAALAQTGADAVMSATALLANPRIRAPATGYSTPLCD